MKVNKHIFPQTVPFKLRKVYNLLCHHRVLQTLIINTTAATNTVLALFLLLQLFVTTNLTCYCNHITCPCSTKWCQARPCEENLTRHIKSKPTPISVMVKLAKPLLIVPLTARTEEKF